MVVADGDRAMNLPMSLHAPEGGSAPPPAADREIARAQPRRRWIGAAAAASMLALLGGGVAGCASIRTLQADISTYGEWPPGRAPGRYAFDRLPSQAARPEFADRLEAAARPALAAAGLREAAPGETPDLLVQLAARSTRTDPLYWDDPMWWRGGFYMSRRGGWVGPMWVRGPMVESPRYEREVAVLLRDQSTGRPLYETRASSEGFSGASEALFEAMFSAAMTDFPRSGPNPRTVRVPMP
jgi:hypothetical protein